MSEEKISLEKLVQKVDELVNLLKVLSGDLAEVSKSLKAATKTADSPSSVTSVESSRETLNINDVKQAFSSELAGMLLFEESGKFIIVKPRRFLGSENFGQIASIVRTLGGEYVSAGRNSHFKVSK